MAIRLDKAFGGGATTWYQMQAAYDLAQAADKSDSINVDRIELEISAGYRFCTRRGRAVGVQDVHVGGDEPGGPTFRSGQEPPPVA